MAKSLEGNWREELLCNLRQSLELYECYQRKIAECDTQIEATSSPLTVRSRSQSPLYPPPSVGRRKPDATNRPLIYTPNYTASAAWDFTDRRHRGAHCPTLIAAIGLDLSRWKSEKHFASGLGGCPDNRISGGRVLTRGTRDVGNRAADALRLAAQNLLHSNSALGANYRRLRARLGAPKAITAMAHKLARLVYRMLKFGQQYVDKGMDIMKPDPPATAAVAHARPVTQSTTRSSSTGSCSSFLRDAVRVVPEVHLRVVFGDI